MSLSLPRVSCFFLLLACILVLGCGGGGGAVKGKVLKGGQPLKVSDKGMVQVRFINESDGFTAPVGPDGSFTLTGNEGKGIPAGKYKIAVLAYDPYPTKDLLAGKFSAMATPVNKDVKPGDDVVIDLDKP